MIPYGRQSINEDDIRAVVNVLRSEFLTQGPAVPAFEKAVAAFCGAENAVVVANATAALHLACLALDLGPGDELWTSPNTFVASANCARYAGAAVDFVDIDPLTLNMDPKELRRKLELRLRTGKALPKVVVPVHFAGQPCDMAAIGALAKEFRFSIIEDASHAVGAHYGGKPVGACVYSDLTIFSFHPVKIVTSGEGGMILTNHSALARRLERLRSHGITRDPALMTEATHGSWYYQQLELGFNYRLPDILAALGHSQFLRLPEMIQRRHEIAARYDRELADLPLQLPSKEPDTVSALHLYVVQLEKTTSAERHRRIFECLREAGIGVNLHYIPVHLQPYYWNLGFREGDFPKAEAYYRRAISLPIYYGLSEADQSRVIAALRKVLT